MSRQYVVPGLHVGPRDRLQAVRLAVRIYQRPRTEKVVTTAVITPLSCGVPSGTSRGPMSGLGHRYWRGAERLIPTPIAPSPLAQPNAHALSPWPSRVLPWDKTVPSPLCDARACGHESSGLVLPFAALCSTHTATRADSMLSPLQHSCGRYRAVRMASSLQHTCGH